MQTKFKFSTALRALSLLATLSLQLSSTFAQGTAFTYQGRLTVDTSAANGIYDLTFSVYDDNLPAGTLIGGPATNTATVVSNGLFVVVLDFGNVFLGADRWLEMGVRTNGSSGFTTLAGRQRITPAPYALYSANAGTAGNVAGSFSGDVNGTQGSTVVQSVGGYIAAAVASGASAANAATSVNMAGTLVKRDGLGNFSAGAITANSFTGDGSGLANVSAATLGSLSSSNFWQTGGNVDTTTDLNFLGTTDQQALEMRVGGRRAFRLEPATDTNTGYGFSPNVIGGYESNSVAAGVVGATISGGGRYDAPGNQDLSHHITAHHGTIGGGDRNTVSGVDGTVAGGGGNWAGGAYSSIAGGLFNTVGSNNPTSTGFAATIAGGLFNSSSADDSTVGGGYANSIQANAQYATIPGGFNNTVSGSNSLAAGRNCYVPNPGCFMWSDGTLSFTSSKANAFYALATGGFYFYTGSGVGVQVAGGGNSWSALSDRNMKENFEPVDAQAVLEKVVALPMSTWNLKTQPPEIRHIGAMAQDFAAAFKVGEDNRHISTSDADGVALTAIQGLNQKLEDRSQKLEAENLALKQQLAELKAMVTQLAQGQPK